MCTRIWPPRFTSVLILSKAAYLHLELMSRTTSIDPQFLWHLLAPIFFTISHRGRIVQQSRALSHRPLVHGQHYSSPDPPYSHVSGSTLLNWAASPKLYLQALYDDKLVGSCKL